MKTINSAYVRNDKNEVMMKGLYVITVDNSRSMSFNINIDRPTYECFAYSECEAYGIMMLHSNFDYKHCKVISIRNLFDDVETNEIRKNPVLN